MGELGRLFIILGAVLFVIGLALLYAPKIPYLGRLPGDFVIRRENMTVYFPLATSLLVSLALTLLLHFFGKK